MHFYSLLLAGLFTNGSMWAAPGDERWGREFYASSFGTVHALAFTSNGDLICGGAFQGIAGVAGTQNIARWDGTNWRAIGGGLSGATIYAILPVGNDLIVGGIFTSVAGQAITNLARWDGTNWSSVGGGVTGGSVRALAMHNGTLIVGGLFTRAGGNAVGYIAGWDGVSWNNLAGGMQASSPSGSAPPVRSFLSLSSGLYVGGRFFSAGGTDANNIARWNGTIWESLGTGANNGVDNSVAALTVDTNGNVYVGGTFTRAGTVPAGLIAMWNGTSWTALSGGLGNFGGPAIVQGLVWKDSDLYVGGQIGTAGTNFVGGLARWDGAEWHSVLAPIYNVARTLALNGDNLYAGGPLIHPMLANPANGLAAFDGQRWFILGGGLMGGNNQASLHTVASSNGKIQVSGFFDISDGSGSRNMVAEWDGRAWNNLGNGLRVGYPYVNDLIYDFLTTNGVTYAAGRTYSNAVMVLTNDAWTDIGASLQDVGRSVAWYRGELFAGHGSGISRWMGTGWTNVATGINGAVYALAVVSDQLYAGGAFSNSGPTMVNNIARWDGTNWSSLQSGVNALVYSLAAFHDVLYAGGDFTEAGGTPASRIAKWSDSGWQALGSGLGEGIYQGTTSTNDSLTRVYSLKVLSDGRLLAAGNFTRSGSNIVNFIASWDGLKWSSLGSGVNDWILDMDGDNSDIYIGGHFTTAGNVSSLRFARWHIPRELRVSIAAAPGNPSQVFLGITGEPGTRFAVEVSTNLFQWNPTKTNTLLGETMLVPVTIENSSTFFRLRDAP